MIKSKNTNCQLITIALAIIAIAILIGALCTATSYKTVSAEQSAGAVVENLAAPVQATPNELYATTIVLFDLSNCKITAGGKTYNCSVSITYLATEQLFILLNDLGNAEETISNRLALSDEVENGVVVNLYSDTGEYYDYYMKRNGDTSLVCKIKLANFEREFINGLKGTSAYADIQITNNNNNPAVIYNCDGGYFEETPEQNISIGRPYVKGEQFQIAGTPIKPGYKFRGWLKGNTLHAPNSLATFYTDGDINFKAFWDITTCEITYKVIFKNGKVSDFTDYNNTAIENYTVLDNVTLTNHFYPAEGCNLYRWYYASDLVNENGSWKLKEGAVAKTGWNAGEQTGNITVYAVEIPIYYLITYDWNGGRYENWQVGSFPTKFSPVMEVHINSAGSPFKTAYEFTGWKVEGTDTIITEGKQKLKYTNDITLIAQWRAINYTIIYKNIVSMHQSSTGVNILKLRDSNSQTYNIDNTPYGLLSLDTDAYREIAGGIPFYTDGYDAIGWIPSECVTLSDNSITYDKTQAITELELGAYGDKTFYRIFEPHYYEITYDWNGGRYENWQVGSFPSYFSPAINVNINSAGSPFKNGYEFTGWKVEGTNTIITEGEQKLNYFNNITLIAQWKPLKYTISYKYINLFSEIMHTSHKNASYTIEDNVSMDKVLKSMTGFTGRDFHYWIPSSYINIVDGTKVTLDEGYQNNAIKSWNAGEQIGDLTFYAVAYYINYTITYLLNSEPVQFNTDVRTSYTYNESQDTEIPLPDMSTITPIKMPSSEFNYICVGWYTNEDLSGNAVHAISLNSYSNKVYHLKIKDMATVTYKVLYGKEAGYDDPDIQYVKEHKVGELFAADYIYTCAYKKRGGFYSVIIFLSVVNEYVFKGWSLEESTHKEWDKGEYAPLVRNGDFAYTEDVTLYAVFEKTKQNYAYEWIWNTSFRVDVDNRMKDEMTKEVAYGKHNVVFSYIVDYANDRNVTEIYHSYTTEADNTTLVLPNTEDFEKSIEDTIFGVNYKFVGWTLWQPEVNIYMLSVWDSIRYKDDFSKYSMNIITTQEEANEIKVTGNMALIGVFVKLSVWNSWFSSSDNAKPFPDKDKGEEEPSSIVSVLSSFFGIDMTSKGFQDFLKFFKGKLSLKEVIEGYTWVKIVVIVLGIVIGISIIAFLAKIIIAIKNAKTASEVKKLSRQIKQKELEELKKNKGD